MVVLAMSDRDLAVGPGQNSCRRLWSKSGKAYRVCTKAEAGTSALPVAIEEGFARATGIRQCWA